MGYFRRIIEAGMTKEIYNTFVKSIGKKEREARKKATPEEIEKINECNAAAKLTRLLNANFKKGDLHLVLTYFREVRPRQDEAKKNLTKFLRDMRREYKKLGEEFKYVHVTEYKAKSIHHHLVINNIDGENVLKLVRNKWQLGNPKFTTLDGTGQYKDLAEYFVKETKKTFKEKGGQKQRYTPSRNLIRPKPNWKIMKRNRWPNNPTPPRGWYVDRDTVYNGVNPFTGREYQKYTLIRLDAEPPETLTQSQWKEWIEEKRKWISWKEAKLNRCNCKK